MYSFPYSEQDCCSMSSSNCCFLTCIQISQEAGQVVWYSHLLKNLPQFVVIHTVKGFGMVNKAEVDVFLELSCFFNDPMDIGNFISCSSAFSKSSLNIWKFTVHILLRPGLKNFEHYFTNMWDDYNCAVVWTFFSIDFFGTRMKTDISQSCGHCWVFQICWHIECSTFTASSFRIWNSSTGIPSLPLVLPQFWLSLYGGLWVLVPTRLVWALWASLAGKGFDSKCDFIPPTILLGLLLCPWAWVIFFWWDPTFSSQWWFNSEL